LVEQKLVEEKKVKPEDGDDGGSEDGDDGGSEDVGPPEVY
jgi:hypothetical protein